MFGVEPQRTRLDGRTSAIYLITVWSSPWGDFWWPVTATLECRWLVSNNGITRPAQYRLLFLLVSPCRKDRGSPTFALLIYFLKFEFLGYFLGILFFDNPYSFLFLAECVNFCIFPQVMGPLLSFANSSWALRTFGAIRIYILRGLAPSGIYNITHASTRAI